MGTVGVLAPTAAYAQLDPLTAGTDIGIMAWSGHYLSAINGGGGLVLANRVLKQEWETFHVIPLRNRPRRPLHIGNYYFLTTYSNWVLEPRHSNRILRAERNTIGIQSEIFIRHLGGDRYSIWSRYGWWSAINGGGGEVLTDFSAPNNAFSQFRLVGV
jgi:hypothetical protein